MNNESCLDMNDELWRFRHDLTTQPATMVVFVLLYATIIVLGTFGNICVILAIATTRSLQTVPNLFIFSLSCSDVVVCCTSATITPITAFKKEWLFGATLCSVAPFIAGISLCFSTFTLTAISVDRFLLICFPMKKALTRPHALIVIGGICAMAACLSAPIMLKQRLHTFENFCGKFCTEDWGSDQNGRRVYGTVMVGVQFVVPLTIIIICYTAISMKLGQGMLIKGKRNNYEWQMEMTDQQRAAIRRRQRTNRMLICMVLAFSASWLWSVLFNVLRDYDRLPGWMKTQEYLYGIATHCIAMTSTVWNPLLYALLNPQLRAAFIRLMPICVQWKGGVDRYGGLIRNGTLLETGVDGGDSISKQQRSPRQAISCAQRQYGTTENQTSWHSKAATNVVVHLMITDERCLSKKRRQHSLRSLVQRKNSLLNCRLSNIRRNSLLIKRESLSSVNIRHYFYDYQILSNSDSNSSPVAVCELTSLCKNPASFPFLGSAARPYFNSNNSLLMFRKHSY